MRPPVAKSTTAIRLLRFTRRLAMVAVALSILILPFALIGLVSGLSPDLGDNGIGDVFAQAAGITLLVLGAVGAILGATLAILAGRALSNPVEIHASRRIVLVVGLIVAGVQVVVAGALGGGWLPVAFLVGAYAAGFLVVAAATRERVGAVIAGVLAIALLGLGAVPLAGQASQNTAGASRDERVGLLPPDWPGALAAAAAAAPDGWAVPTLTARITDYAPSQEGVVLPPTLADRPLRGILVVDCAGSDRLQAVVRDPDAGFGDAPIELGMVICDPEPSNLLIDVPGESMHADSSGTYVLGISLEPVNEGPAGGMHRAVLLVAPIETPDPERNALVATFVAAFGVETPR